jgi:hypothetical protein
MRFDQSQNESSYTEALPGGEAGRCKREPKRSVATGVADLQRLGVERFEQCASEARLWRTSGALAQQGAPPDGAKKRAVGELGRYVL